MWQIFLIKDIFNIDYRLIPYLMTLFTVLNGTLQLLVEIPIRLSLSPGHCHIVTLTLSLTQSLLYCCNVNVTLPMSHTVTVSLSLLVMHSHYHILTVTHTITLSFHHFHTVTTWVSHCHHHIVTSTLSHCHCHSRIDSVTQTVTVTLKQMNYSFPLCMKPFFSQIYTRLVSVHSLMHLTNSMLHYNRMKAKEESPFQTFLFRINAECK